MHKGDLRKKKSNHINGEASAVNVHIKTSCSRFSLVITVFTQQVLH